MLVETVNGVSKLVVVGRATEPISRQPFVLENREGDDWELYSYHDLYVQGKRNICSLSLRVSQRSLECLDARL